MTIFDLTGHNSLITGGNSGVGLGMAHGLARAGANVCIWGTNESKNVAAAEALRAHGTQIEAMRVDVGDEARVIGAMAETVTRFGGLDSCFANAAVTGGWSNPPFIDSTLEQWRSLMRVNLDGTYVTLREAAKVMVAQGRGGSLIATSSIAAHFGSAREEAYSASKAGIEAMVRGLAVELAKHRIRVNTLVPGWTMSPQTEKWADAPGVGDKILARVPMRRWGQPEEWEGVAVYLAGGASTWHTGDTLRLDGGFSAF
jgi:NAD(P)-dependent dehydrogenase (short-subunit alcohol dehydrogenase family)